MSRSFPIIAFLLAFLLQASVQATEILFQPYSGPVKKGVDTKTLTGKVMCGYQGWFNTPGDGAGIGWVHWGRESNRQMGPDAVTIDLWPDVSEYDADELYPTGFLHKNGKRGMVFSSYNRKTVLRHFEWMETYGIDGVFVQRFVQGLWKQGHQNHRNTVLAHAREGANRTGRTYALMYDLSGIRSRDVDFVIDDWKRLRSRAHLGKDPAYLHHEGKPLVAVWGIGFNDGRRYNLEDCRRIIEVLKADGCAVMVGVPTAWRTQGADAVKDPNYHEILKLADVLSPWAVGRYGNIPALRRHARTYYGPDRSWCEANEMDYLPVVFPGFSWHNLRRGERPLGQIPRLRGRFLWEQIYGVKTAGCEMVYVAMFDEVDEGTAIFKCTNDPPTANGGRFIDFEGLPSDFYLRLTGHAGRVIRDEAELPASGRMPSL